MEKKSIRVILLVGILLLAFSGGAYAKSSGGDGGNGSFSKTSLKGTYSFRFVPATSFAPFISGSDAAGAPRQDILRVGVFTADGKGNLTGGHTIATTDDGLTTVIIDFKWTGTYTVNSDGTGTLIIEGPSAGDIKTCVTGDNPPKLVTGCEGFEGRETYAFVLNNHGEDKLVSLTETDNNGGGAKIFLTGEAKRNSGSD